jgi:hypothetical protein
MKNKQQEDIWEYFSFFLGKYLKEETKGMLKLKFEKQVQSLINSAILEERRRVLKIIDETESIVVTPLGIFDSVLVKSVLADEKKLLRQKIGGEKQ